MGNNYKWRSKVYNVREPVLAWVSRHKPTAAQTASLCRYQIVQIDTAHHHFRNHHEVWNVIRQMCGKPCVIMAVLPVPMLVALVHFVQPIPLIRAEMSEGHDDARACWTGRWRRVLDAQLIYVEWTPEVEA